MGRGVKILYSQVRPNGRRYWEPTKAMVAAGAAPYRALGPEGAAAQREALRLLHEWQAIRHGRALPEPEPARQSREMAEVARRWPPGSIGAAYVAYMRTPEWGRKAASTRNRDILPAWAYIRDEWGDCDPNGMTLDLLSEWRAHLVAKHGLGVAHRVFKEWRRHWKVMRALGYVRIEDPSLGIRNDDLPPRWQTWTAGEVVRIVKAAIRAGDLRMAAFVAVTWDTQFQPGDVRTLRARHLVPTGPAGDGLIFDRRVDGREKTGKAAIGTLSPRSRRLLRAYLDRRPAMTPEAFIFPMASGRVMAIPEASKYFRAVCELVFPGDKRQLRDMRRSGTVEAFAGGASPADVASKSANAINRSDRLFKTYNPVDLASVRRADEARIAGRKRRREGT